MLAEANSFHLGGNKHADIIYTVGSTRGHFIFFGFDGNGDNS
jgi:hypothetical protein